MLSLSYHYSDEENTAEHPSSLYIEEPRYWFEFGSGFHA